MIAKSKNKDSNPDSRFRKRFCFNNYSKYSK